MASENYYNPTDDKQIIVVLEAPLGLYSSGQLKTIYELAESYELNVRATEDQRLSIELPKDLFDTVVSTFTENGLSTRPYLRGLHQPIACMGASCQYAQADVLHDSIRITEILADAMLTENKVRIGINGCSRSCVPTHNLDISIVAEEGTYKMFVGGKCSLVPEAAQFLGESIPSDKLPAMVRNVVDTIAKHAAPEEELYDLIERVGISPFAKAIQPFSTDAATSEVSPFSTDTTTELVNSAESLSDSDLDAISFEPADLDEEELSLAPEKENDENLESADLRMDTETVSTPDEPSLDLTSPEIDIGVESFEPVALDLDIEVAEASPANLADDLDVSLEIGFENEAPKAVRLTSDISVESQEVNSSGATVAVDTMDFEIESPPRAVDSLVEIDMSEEPLLESDKSEAPIHNVDEPEELLISDMDEPTLETMEPEILEDSPEISTDIADQTNDLPLSSEVQAATPPSTPTTGSSEGKNDDSFASSTFTGMTFDDNLIYLNFSTGAKLAMSEKKIQEAGGIKTIKFGKDSLVVESNDDGLKFNYCGIEAFFPKKRA